MWALHFAMSKPEQGLIEYGLALRYEQPKGWPLEFGLVLFRILTDLRSQAGSGNMFDHAANSGPELC